MKAVAMTIMAVLFAASTVDAGFNLRRSAPQTQIISSSRPFKVYETTEEQSLDYALQGARGFYQGFNKGLYKIDKLNDACLSADAEEKMVTLFGMIVNNKLDMNKMMTLVADVMTITSSLQACQQSTLSDVGNFCFQNGENRCTPDKIGENVQKNLFVIMAKFTDISNLVMAGVPKDAEKAYTFGVTLGTDMGSLIRIILGFHA